MSEVEISNKFKLAVDYITNNSSKLSNLKNEEQLYLYCNFKQATIGDCNTKSPGFFDYIGKSKWNSWNSLRGVDKLVAMNSYISLVNGISPGWDNVDKSNNESHSTTAAQQQSIFLEDDEFNQLKKLEKEEKDELKKMEELALNNKRQQQIANGEEVTVEKSKPRWMGPVLSKFSMVDEETIEKSENAKQDLGYWVSVNDFKRVLEQVESDPSIVNQVDEDGRTGLIWACDRGYFDIVKYLIDAGADINVQDNEGMTPLHYSVLCNQFEICKLLLSNSNINQLIKDNSDSLAVDFIDSSTNEDIINLLKSSPK